MPAPVKPADRPEWTDANAAVRVQPSDGYKNTGWFSNLRPPFQFMNWLFYNIGTEWRGYFESVTDYLLGVSRPYDFSIGAGGDFADINAAMASASVQPGARLVILNSLVLAITQQVTKNNLQFTMGPGVAISDGGAGTGIQVSATECRFKGGKMSAFTVQAFLIDVGSNYTMISEVMFAANAAEITDNNGKTASWGNIDE